MKEFKDMPPEIIEELENGEQLCENCYDKEANKDEDE